MTGTELFIAPDKSRYVRGCGDASGLLVVVGKNVTPGWPNCATILDNSGFRVTLPAATTVPSAPSNLLTSSAAVVPPPVLQRKTTKVCRRVLTLRLFDAKIFVVVCVTPPLLSDVLRPVGGSCKRRRCA